MGRAHVGLEGRQEEHRKKRFKYHLVVWPAKACHKRSVSVPPSAETERAFTDSLGDLTSLGEEQVFVGLVRGEATCRQWSLSPQPAWWAPEHSLQLLGLLEAQVPA